MNAIMVPEIPVEVLGPPPELLEEVKKYQQPIVVNSQETMDVALVMIKGMKDLHGKIEEHRTSTVSPHNKFVKKVNEAHEPSKTFLDRTWRAYDGLVSAYRAKVKRELEEAQRKAIEEANRVKAEEEAKAAELRRQAEEAKKQQPVLEETREALQGAIAEIQQQKAAAIAEDDQDTLVVLGRKEADLTARLTEISTDVQVVDLEAKAQEAELKAATVAPVVVQQQAKTVESFDGSRHGFQTIKSPILPGALPLDGDYYRDDVRLKELPDSLFVLDVSRLKKWTKDGMKIPGITVVETEASRRR